MSTWDVLTGSATLPSGALTELAALRAALPGYAVTITSHSPAYRFEATRRGDGPGPWCVVRGQHRPRRPLAGTGRAYPANHPGRRFPLTVRVRARSSAPLPSQPSASFLVTGMPVPSMTA